MSSESAETPQTPKTSQGPGGEGSPRRRRRWPWVVAGVAVLAVAAVGLPYLYINVLSPDAPAPFVSDQAAQGPTGANSSTPSAAGSAAGTAAGVPAQADGTWTVSTGSQAGYRVAEVLNGQDKIVVGRTAGVTGSVRIAGGQLTQARVEVDMTSVTTDSSARDGQFNGTIMETATYPTATFRADGPVELGAPGTDVEVPGTLTLKGNEVAVGATVRFEGNVADGVKALGSIPVTFADWGIQAPDLGFVKVERTGTVEFSLVLRKA